MLTQSKTKMVLGFSGMLFEGIILPKEDCIQATPLESLLILGKIQGFWHLVRGAFSPGCFLPDEDHGQDELKLLKRSLMNQHRVRITLIFARLI